MYFDLIVATDDKWGIARKDALPWRLMNAGREDMDYFRRITTEPGTAVIMGRKTWDTIPDKFKPLPNRINIVISTKHLSIDIEGALTESPIVRVGSFLAALDWTSSHYNVSGELSVKHVMVIGGNAIYELALHSVHLRYAFVTVIAGDFGCDMQFPCHYLKHATFSLNNKVINPINEYRVYDMRNIAEWTFLRLMERLLGAPSKPNRTSIPTRFSFHEVLKFNLYESGRGKILPLLTTKEVKWPLIYHELIWFLRGSTNTKYLIDNNVHIWDANTTREFLDSRGLTKYEVGEVGNIYGAQWRNWNGIDQLQKIISTIKKDPWDRRLVVSAWNVEQLDQMALLPCHYAFQFIVTPNENGEPKYLNCIVNMRSADLALGVPFNAVSYALLTHMISHLTNLQSGILSISMADCHIYGSHISGIKEWIKRTPVRFPILKFGPKILEKGKSVTLDDFTNCFEITDYIVMDYVHQPVIRLPMAV